MKSELIRTNDGSHSLFVPEMDETYHSRHGAITESAYIYIDQGLRCLPPPGAIEILEFGFGTGLNALLSLIFSNEHQVAVNYTSVEKFPLTPDIWTALNYGEQLSREDAFRLLHECSWGQPVTIDRFFTLYKYQSDFLEFQPLGQADILFYDAFAPSRQPEVWSLPYLEKARDVLKVGGLLVTYCAQGEFRRNLKSLGFEIISLPGPPGKKEMTRAMRKI